LLNNESHSTCRVFISHSSKDDEFCTRLAEDLRGELGENAVWYDNLRLRAGDRWWRIIVEELSLCDVFILIISPASMESDWVQREYDMAFRQTKRIIPLLYQDTKNIWHDLKDIHHISFTDPERYANAFEKLLQGLPLSKLKNSYNVPEAGNLKKMLDTIKTDFAAKNWDKLIIEVEELKKLRAESVTSLIYYWQAKAFLALDHKPDAIDALEKAHAMESNEKRRLRILSELIPALASLKQWTAVEKSTTMALKISPGEPMFLSQRRDALLALLKSTSDRKQLLSFLYDLCATLALLGRWNDVLLYTNEALQLAPDNLDFLMQRRDALLAMLNNHERRLRFLRELCSILASLEQWNDILRYTEDALHWVPDDHDFLILRRDVLERLLPTAHEQEPRLKLLRALCSVLAALEQWDDMLAYSQEALRLAPGDFYLLTQQRDVLKLLLSNAHGQEQYLKPMRELCLVLATLGQWEEALQYAGKVRQANPKDYDIIKLQNHARIHLGSLKVAAAYDTFSNRMRAFTAYWGRFIQNLLGSVQQLMRRRWLIPVTSILLILVIIGSILIFLPRGGPSMVIKIGVNVPGRGDSQDNGLPIEQGVDLAIQDASIPGYTLQLDFQDEVPSGSFLPDSTQAKKNMQSFISDAQVAGVIGPYESSIAKEIMHAANIAPIALISPSNTYPCLTKDSSDAGCSGQNDLLPMVRPTGKVTYFRIAPTDDYQGPAIANYLFENLKPRTRPATVYVIDDGEVYGMGLATSFINEWRKLNGSVIAYKHDSDTNDYPSLVQAMSKKPPDVVFFAGRTDLGAEEFYQQLQFNNALQHTVYAGGSGLVSPPDFPAIVSPITNPIYASFPFVDVESLPGTASFRDHFKRVEGANDYGRYTAPGYDSANVLLQAIKTVINKGVLPPRNASDVNGAKVFRQAVIDAIQGISYDGITGHISFDTNGDTTNRALTIYNIVDVNGQPGWKCLEQVTINNPSTVQWLNDQKAFDANMCPLDAK
jgi:branched-chain amino acid transport system substrate-binding protein